MNRFLSIDYNGTPAEYLNSHGFPNIPTTTSGSIKETLMNDGRAKVTVDLHTENALTFAFTSATGNFGDAPPDFGYRPGDLLADHSLKPALGTCDFSITFYNPAMDEAIPDIRLLLENQIQDVVKLTVNSTSTGTFHALSGFSEGTQGTVTNHQIGQIFKLFNGNDKNDKNIFPQERITYKADK
jgi:hypothetical protein